MANNEDSKPAENAAAKPAEDAAAKPAEAKAADQKPADKNSNNRGGDNYSRKVLRATCSCQN